MRYLGKALGPVVLAVVAMMVVGAGGASATALTSSAGTPYSSEIHAVAGEIKMDTTPYASFACKKSTIRGDGGSSPIPVTDLTFSECGTDTVTVLKSGQLELQGTGGGNATMRSTGAEFTVLTHKTVLGFPVTTHCIFQTNNTHIGTFTGSSTTKATAALDVNSNLLTRETDSNCGAEPVLTGTYTVISPDVLDVEAEGDSLTSPSGSFVKTGAMIKAESSNLHLTGTVKVACKKSTLEAEIANAGGPGITISGPVNALAFSECAPDTVTVIKGGSLELHATSGGNGTLTSTGAEITLLTHKTVLGFPITAHCIYKTEGTDLGTFTGSSATKATAVLDVNSSLLRNKTDGACGEDPAILTGSYTITSPDYLDVD